MLEFAYVDDRDQTLVLLHGGPNDYTDPDGETRIARDVRFAKTPYQHAGAPFAWHCMAPGIKTIVHMSQDGETFKMVVTTAEAVKDELTFCSYTHGRVRVKGIHHSFSSVCWKSVSRNTMRLPRVIIAKCCMTMQI